MRSFEPAVPLAAGAVVLLAGSDDAGWLLVAAAVLVLAIGRWEAYALGLPGAAAVVAGLAAQGPRWHLVLSALALVAGAVAVLRRRQPAEPLTPPRAVALIPAAALVVAAGWLPALDLRALEAYREGAVLAAAGGAVTAAALLSTAVFRARSGKMEDPAPAGGAEAGA